MGAVAVRRAKLDRPARRYDRSLGVQLWPGLAVVAIWLLLSTGQWAQSPVSASSPVPSLAATNNPSISGAIWWDSKRIRTSSSAPGAIRKGAKQSAQQPSICSGLSVTAILQTGPAPAPQPGDLFLPDPPTSPAGAMRGFKPSTNGSLVLCNFTISNVPEGVNLLVHATINPTEAPFQEPVAAAANQLGFFKIPGGECRSSALSNAQTAPKLAANDLESPVKTCGNSASNVNFEIQQQLPPLN